MTEMIELPGLIEHLGNTRTSRVLVAIAGPPGSGKSTVAEKLEAGLNARREGSAAILPMDGFHYDDMLLEQWGARQRKGAPDTFDVAGFRHILQRLRDKSEPHVAVPVFDRDIEISRGGARLISQAVPIIIVEGNYVLLAQEPWAQLRPLFATTVMVATPEDILRERLTARWRGYNLPDAEIHRRVEENDLPNGRFVLRESAAADFMMR